MKKCFVILTLILLCNCTSKNITPNYISLGISEGQDTSIERINHTRDNEKVSTKRIEIEIGKKKDNWRYGMANAITNHKFKNDNNGARPRERYNGYSFDITLFLKYEKELYKKWFIFTGIGGGLGILEPNKGHPLIGDSKVTGILYGEVGVKKEFKKYFIEALYKLRHTSDPLNKRNGNDQTDSGENTDEIELRVGTSFKQILKWFGIK